MTAVASYHPVTVGLNDYIVRRVVDGDVITYSAWERTSGCSHDRFDYINDLGYGDVASRSIPSNVKNDKLRASFREVSEGTAYRVIAVAFHDVRGTRSGGVVIVSGRIITQ